MKSVNGKMIGAAVGVALVCGGLAAAGMYVARDLNDGLSRAMASATLLRAHMHADMMHDALRADVLAAIVARDPAAKLAVDDIRHDFDEHTAEFRKDIADGLAAASGGPAEPALEKIVTPLAAYISSAGRVIDLARNDPATAMSAIDGFFKEFRTLEDAMENAADDIENVANAEADHARVSASTGTAIIAGLFGAGVVILLLIGLFVRRGVVRPLNDLAGAVERLAGGDLATIPPHAGRQDEIGRVARAMAAFREAMAGRQSEAEAAEQRRLVEEERARNETLRARAAAEQATVVEKLAEGLAGLRRGTMTVRLSEAFADEYEGLRRDFNEAVEELEKTLTGIVDGVGGIGSGISEMGQASDDLSRRTEQQAASLEQTAAALDQITVTVRKTASSVTQASGVVTAAKADAEASGEIVRQAVAAMAEIETSAREISQIIGVIDEIAFQTNLLALNAGVEAARAGDAGKGFAVVAQEVRALAQRSAQAAKEIKALIAASGAQVERGVSLVGDAGQALERIVDQVGQIDDVISGIAAGADQQATGLDEVNSTVNHMDQLTQQNAAMVEQSTAAVHTLSREAGSLVAAVSRFELSRGTTAPAANGVVVPDDADAALRPRRRRVAASGGGGWTEF